MRREELSAVGELLADAAAAGTLQVGQMHRGIAGRVWRAVGPAAAPVRFLHDHLATGAYQLSGGLARAGVRAGVEAMARAQREDSPSLQRSAAGRVMVGALNGVWGDTLDRRGNLLALPMTVRHGGRDLALTRGYLREAFPEAQGRLAVFVHGLCETDEAWMLGGARSVPYGYRLQAELGFTPIYVRYNTGLHVSHNGRRLAQLLDHLLAAWPRDVHEIALVGHSMGGLVARSACHYGAGSEWVEKVRHVFTLGSPHLGAPLEQAAHVISAAFSRLPETRALLAAPLNLRSAGIKDLRYGYLVDECWDAQDCDAFLRNTSRQVPFLASANHYFICATLSREADGLAARLVGDMLVLRASAWSWRSGERLRFAIEHYHHLGQTNHFELLNHPAVYVQMRRWLKPRPALPRAQPA